MVTKGKCDKRGMLSWEKSVQCKKGTIGDKMWQERKIELPYGVLVDVRKEHNRNGEHKQAIRREWR